MAVLDNPRHEQFAQLVATGKTPAEAYAAAGYSDKTAYTCGPRLLKLPSVRARVVELQQAVGQATVTRIAIDRERVLAGLWAIAQKGQSESARVRAYELCGKELGMFDQSSENKMDWIAKLELAAKDLRNLTDDELQRLAAAVFKLTFGDDQAAIDAARRRAKIEAGTLVVDVEPGAPEVGGAEVPRPPEPTAGNGAQADPAIPLAGSRHETPNGSVKTYVGDAPPEAVKTRPWFPKWTALLPKSKDDPDAFYEEMKRRGSGRRRSSGN